MTAIPGYTYGTNLVARSPLTERDLAELEASTLFTADDAAALREAGDIVERQVEEILDVWYGFVAGNPHLVAAFAGADGKPDSAYLAAVRKRFGQWILDTCRRPHDRAWLDYQHEIGLRHHRAKKNRTDNVHAAPVVPLRHLVALIVPIVVTMKPFLAKGAKDAAALEQMHTAWLKAVTLQVALWSRAYVGEADY
jgi:hypothetical protein